jgi:uncharacterized repeat protein (TIGR03803 family)
MIQATDGNFYSTTYDGGAYSEGTIFKMTPSGALTTLYAFCSDQSFCLDGANPVGGLVQGIDGNLYGLTICQPPKIAAAWPAKGFPLFPRSPIISKVPLYCCGATRSTSQRISGHDRTSAYQSGMDEKTNILMVDDQPRKLLTYEVMLSELGENLIKAHSGMEALEHLLKTDIALVLMDVSMPGM